MAFPWSAGDQLDADDLNAILSVTDEAADTECFPIFVTAATGNLQHKSHTALKFNASTGLLESTLFGGNGLSLTNLPLGASASDTLQQSADTERSVNNNGGLAINKGIRISRSGVVRLKADLKWAGSSLNGSGCFYLNGVAADSVISPTTSYVTSSLDLTVKIGDLVQFALSSFNATTTTYVKNFRVCYTSIGLTDIIITD